MEKRRRLTLEERENLARHLQQLEDTGGVSRSGISWQCEIPLDSIRRLFEATMPGYLNIERLVQGLRIPEFMLLGASPLSNQEIARVAKLCARHEGKGIEVGYRSNNFCARIQELMVAGHMNEASMVQATGISGVTVKKILNGKEPRESTKEIFADELEIPLEKLDGPDPLREEDMNTATIRRYSRTGFGGERGRHDPAGALAVSGWAKSKRQREPEPAEPEGIEVIDRSEFGDWLSGSTVTGHSVLAVVPAAPEMVALAWNEPNMRAGTGSNGSMRKLLVISRDPARIAEAKHKARSGLGAQVIADIDGVLRLRYLRCSDRGWCFVNDGNRALETGAVVAVVTAVVQVDRV